MNKYSWTLSMIAFFFSCNFQSNEKLGTDAAGLAKNSLQDITQVQLIDSLYNFGTVSEGEKVAFNFRFVNVGNKPLIVSSASASCGCTIAEKPEMPIMAGDTGFIRVVFNSMGKIGPNHKVISVEANTNPEFPVLVVTGEVKQ